MTPEQKSFYYADEADLLNVSLFGVTAMCFGVDFLFFMKRKVYDLLANLTVSANRYHYSAAIGTIIADESVPP